MMRRAGGGRRALLQLLHAGGPTPGGGQARQAPLPGQVLLQQQARSWMGAAAALAREQQQRQPFSSAAAAAEQQQQQQPPPSRPPRPTIFAACVLERLPIVKSPPPEWEAEYKAWTQLRRLDQGAFKHYPLQEKKQRASEQADKGASELAPATTKADARGKADTMKRRLTEKLVLLVKARVQPAGAQQQQQQQQQAWTFPFTAHHEGETIRAAAERALKEVIGPSQVYFVGNAPMAHLDVPAPAAAAAEAAAEEAAGAGAAAAEAGAAALRPGRRRAPRPAARVFFHLAQVVNDPWDVSLAGGAASEYAWVARDELGSYIRDERLLALAHQML